MKKIAGALALLLAASLALELPQGEWNRTFGGTGQDYAYAAQQTSDGGYALAGTTNYDFWLVKTDSNGNEQWNRTFHDGDDERAYALQQTSDGGYIIAGYNTPGGMHWSFWLVKTDALGNHQWNRTYGYNDSGYSFEEAHSVQQTSDGGYLAAGYTDASGRNDFWLVKTDASGNPQWNRTFGGSYDDTAYSARQASDGGYIVAGYKRSALGYTDVWLVKTDADGNEQWNKTLGVTDYEEAYSVQQTSDGGYIIAGYTYPSGGTMLRLLIKTDASGNEQWNRTLGGDQAYSVQQTPDGGYVIGGTNQDFSLVRTDANGNKAWEISFGGINGDTAYSAQQTSDGGYMLAGTTSSFGAGQSDAWLVKIRMVPVGLQNSSWPKFHYDLRNTGQSPYISYSNGTVKWTYETSSSIWSSPVIDSNGIVYVGSDDYNLYAIYPDGTLKWNFTTSWISSSPVIAADGTVYLASGDGKLYALNPDGTPRWNYSTGQYIWGSPAVAPDGTVYVAGNGSRSFYAINPDGTLKWNYPVPGEIWTSPAVAQDGTIYFADGNKLYALNPDGTLKWEYTVGYAEASPAIAADGTVYIGNNVGIVYALNPDGTLRWNYTTGGGFYSGIAVASDGTIYAGADRLYAFNPDGSLKWSYVLSGSITYASPAIASDGTVYVGTSYYGSPYFYAINPDGTLKWNFTDGSSIYSSPAIAADGTVYVGIGRNLYAFISEPPGPALNITLPQEFNITLGGTNASGANVSIEIVPGQLYPSLTLNSSSNEIVFENVTFGPSPYLRVSAVTPPIRPADLGLDGWLLAINISFDFNTSGYTVTFYGVSGRVFKCVSNCASAASWAEVPAESVPGGIRVTLAPGDPILAVGYTEPPSVVVAPEGDFLIVALIFAFALFVFSLTARK